MKHPFARVAVLLVLLLVLIPAAHAQSGMMDDLLQTLSASRDGWLRGIKDFSAWLFFFMASIGAVWTFGMLMLRGPDFGEFFVTFTRFCVMVALFAWLLDVVPGNWSAAGAGTNGAGSGFIMGLDETMQTLARRMAGAAPSPDGLLQSGWKMMDAVIKASDGAAVSDKQYGMLSNMAIITMVALAVAAVNIVLLSITLWFLAYAGVFLLGFAGARWSSDIAIGYFKTVLAVVVSLMALRLVSVVALLQIDRLYGAQVAGHLTLQGVSMMMVLSVALAVIMSRLPGLLSSGILGASVARGGAYSVSVQALATAGHAFSTGSQSLLSESRQAYERLSRSTGSTTDSSRMYDTAVQPPVIPTYSTVTAPYGNYASLHFRTGQGGEAQNGGTLQSRAPAMVASPQVNPESSDWTRSTWASRQRDPSQDAVFDTNVEHRRQRQSQNQNMQAVPAQAGSSPSPMWQEHARQDVRQERARQDQADQRAERDSAQSVASRAAGGIPQPHNAAGTAGRNDRRMHDELQASRSGAGQVGDPALKQPALRQSTADALQPVRPTQPSSSAADLAKATDHRLNQPGVRRQEGVVQIDERGDRASGTGVRQPGQQARSSRPGSDMPIPQHEANIDYGQNSQRGAVQGAASMRASAAHAERGRSTRTDEDKPVQPSVDTRQTDRVPQRGSEHAAQSARAAGLEPGSDGNRAATGKQDASVDADRRLPTTRHDPTASAVPRSSTSTPDAAAVQTPDGRGEKGKRGEAGKQGETGKRGNEGAGLQARPRVPAEASSAPPAGVSPPSAAQHAGKRRRGRLLGEMLSEQDARDVRRRAAADKVDDRNGTPGTDLDEDEEIARFRDGGGEEQE